MINKMCKTSGFKLPHMSKSPVAYHEKGHMIKAEKPVKVTSEEKEMAKTREALKQISQKPLLEPKPLKPEMRGPINFDHDDNDPVFQPQPDDKVPSFDETFRSSSGGDSSDDKNLNEFLKRVESRKIKNPEYADVEGPEYSKSYDFFITNRNEESDKVAKQMDSLNKVVMNQAKNRQFDEMKKTRAYQQELMNRYNID